MFRFRNSHSVVIPAGKHTLVVDDFDSKSFNRNDAGWTRNDISQLARAQSASEYEAIAKRLVQLSGEGSVKPGTTIEQAISQIKPSFVQSPAEIEQFIQMTQPAYMENLNKAYEKVIKEGKVDPPSKGAPVPAPAVEPSPSVTE